MIRPLTPKGVEHIITFRSTFLSRNVIEKAGPKSPREWGGNRGIENDGARDRTPHMIGGEPIISIDHAFHTLNFPYKWL